MSCRRGLRVWIPKSAQIPQIYYVIILIYKYLILCDLRRFDRAISLTVRKSSNEKSPFRGSFLDFGNRESVIVLADFSSRPTSHGLRSTAYGLRIHSSSNSSGDSASGASGATSVGVTGALGAPPSSWPSPLKSRSSSSSSLTTLVTPPM